uniref:Protein FAR1-RELATED SEQUENCE n=1 Tax=Lactuca sativa TaxID=4236 RepID=A0A9R1XG69_LACSA|nr:hypothetical protein LSAT_V11C500236860 [Lactuca sativa]
MRDDIHPMETNEVDENNSFNESNYFFDDTSPFETDIHPMDANEADENESLNESRYFFDDTSPFKTNMVFNSRQELMDWVQNMANTLGYVIVIKNSKRNFNVVFQCDRGGTYKSTQISKKKQEQKKLIVHLAYMKCKLCWDVLYTSWTRLVNSETKEAYNKNLAQVEKITNNYPDAFSYLNKTWLTPHKEKFVSAWTDKFLNFGNHTTNRAESQHAKLKRYVETSRSDIAKSLKRIADVVESQYTGIKASLAHNKILIVHRYYEIPHLKPLCRFISVYALDIIFKEYERSKEFGFVYENCGCQVHTSYGLPCAHEQAIFVKKKLDLLECKSLEDDNLGCAVEVNMFNAHYEKQSRPVKLSLVRKLLNLITPSTTSVSEPATHKNTRGRPSLKKKLFKKTHIDLNQDPPTQDPPPQDQPTQAPPTQYLSRRSISTYTPDYMRSNLFDLNQEPDRHSTYSFREPPMFNSTFNLEQSMHSSYFNREQVMYNSDPLMNEISYEFHPYVTNIQNVRGDGNCGFRAIAACLGYSEDNWRQIRLDLQNELLAHPAEYAQIFYYDLNTIHHSLNFNRSHFAPKDRWLIMPVTSFLIANKYDVIVIFLSKDSPSTCFPLWLGPQYISTHRVVVIALVRGDHYVNVDLHGAYLMPTILPFWRHNRSSRSAGWETIYAARLNSYISPFATHSNCNNSTVLWIEGLDDEAGV